MVVDSFSYLWKCTEVTTSWAGKKKNCFIGWTKGPVTSPGLRDWVDQRSSDLSRSAGLGGLREWCDVLHNLKGVGMGSWVESSAPLLQVSN